MDELRTRDVDWRGGRLPFHIWYGGEDVVEIQKKGYMAFMQENGLGAGKSFQSLKVMEDDLLDFAAGLLHGPEAVGHLTSGGSESIFVAMKAARDWARVHHRTNGTPEVVAPYSVHPTLNRAADYLGLRVVRTPVSADFRGDPTAISHAISAQTIAIVGSAPCFPYGVVDPIDAFGRIAQDNNLWLHVDACVGGYCLPFIAQLGHPVPPFDFAVPGVISMSADLHKYAFSAKGASTVLYRDSEFEQYQPFVFDDWPQGRFSNPNMAATRPGGSISAAWAVMNYLGEEGYLRIYRRMMDMRKRYIDGINGIPGLEIRGEPHAMLVTYGSQTLDMSAVADAMVLRGWYVARQRTPPGITLGLSLIHEPIVNVYLQDLRAAVEGIDQPGTLQGNIMATPY